MVYPPPFAKFQSTFYYTMVQDKKQDFWGQIKKRPDLGHFLFCARERT